MYVVVFAMELDGKGSALTPGLCCGGRTHHRCVLVASRAVSRRRVAISGEATLASPFAIDDQADLAGQDMLVTPPWLDARHS
jgi:hypothetical protein